MKKTLYTVLVICLLIFVVPSFIDWSHFKHPLVAAVKNHTGLEIDLMGAVHLRLLPTLQLSATNVSIKNIPGGKAVNLGEVKSVSLRASLLDLLRGKIKIEKVTLIDPTIYLEILKNGQHNWDLQNGQSIPEKVESLPKEKLPEQQNIDFSLKNIEIKEGTVIFKNFQTDSQQEIKHINVEGSLDSLSGPFAVDGQLEISDYVLKGDIQAGKISGNEKAPFTANLSAAKRQDNYGALQIKGVMQGMNFSGDIQSQALTFPFSINFGTQKIDLQKGIKISAHLVANPQNIQISQLDIESNSLNIKGRAAAALDQWDCGLTLSDGSSKIDLSAKARNKAQSLWEGEIAIHSGKPEAFLEKAGFKTPFLRGDLNVSTRFILKSNIYTFNDLKFKIGSLQSSGAIVIKRDAPVDHIQADLVVNKLDINSFLDTEQDKDIRPENGAHLRTVTSEKWSKEKWNLAFLKAVNVDCSLKIGEIAYDKYKFQEVRGTLHVKNGNLQVNGFQAHAYNGRLSGKGALNQGKEPSMNVSLSAQGVNPAAIPEVTKTPLKKALLDISAALTANGNSLFEMVNSLAGNMQINLKQGAIETFDIKGLIGGLEQVKNPADVSALMTSLNRKSETNFTHLRGDFIVKDGQATTSNLELLSDDVVLMGNGNINLPQWHIDMSAQMKIKGKTRVPSIGVRIEGNLTEPSYKIDQAILGKILLEEVSRRVLDKVVGDKITGTGKLGQVIAGALGMEDKQKPTEKPSSPSQESAPASQSPIKIEKVLSGLFKK